MSSFVQQPDGTGTIAFHGPRRRVESADRFAPQRLLLQNTQIKKTINKALRTRFSISQCRDWPSYNFTTRSTASRHCSPRTWKTRTPWK